MITIAILVVVMALFALVASVVFSWASNRSPAWNLAFGGVVVLTATVIVALAAVLISRWLAN